MKYKFRACPKLALGGLGLTNFLGFPSVDECEVNSTDATEVFCFSCSISGGSSFTKQYEPYLTLILGTHLPV